MHACYAVIDLGCTSHLPTRTGRAWNVRIHQYCAHLSTSAPPQDAAYLENTDSDGWLHFLDLAEIVYTYAHAGVGVEIYVCMFLLFFLGGRGGSRPLDRPQSRGVGGPRCNYTHHVKGTNTKPACTKYLLTSSAWCNVQADQHVYGTRKRQKAARPQQPLRPRPGRRWTSVHLQEGGGPACSFTYCGVLS